MARRCAGLTLLEDRLTTRDSPHTSHEVRHSTAQMRDITTRSNRLENTDTPDRDINSKSVGHLEHMFCESEPHSLFKRARVSEFWRGCGGP